MSDQNELSEIRRELAALMAQAQVLASRLEALESGQAAAAPVPEVVREANVPSPSPEPVALSTPPPLPKPSPEFIPARTLTSEYTEPRRSPAPKTPPPLAEPAWSPMDAVKAAYRALGPKEPMTWEMALGTFWLPRLAVLLLAVGVVWALTLAVQQWGQAWLPYIRIGSGYAVAAALYFGGRYIEGRRREEAAASFLDYARVMMAGGMGLLYFVTFATHYVPYTRIFSSPWVTLSLLTAIIVGWSVVANWRRSWTLGFSVTLLGHFTAALATLTLSQPPTATIVGLLALNLGAGYFFARHGWRLVGLAGVLGGYGNYTLWLANSTPSEEISALAGGLSVLAAYWCIFAVADFVAAGRGLARDAYRLRNLYLSLNSGGLVLLGVGLIDGFSAAEPYRPLFLFVTSGVFLAVGLLYLRARPGDAVYGSYLTKASALCALGLADYLEGTALTLSLAIEAVVLLYSARRSGLVAPRALALLVVAAELTHGFVSTLSGQPPFGAGMDPWSVLAPTGMTLVALLYFAFLYSRTEWPLLPASSLARFPGLHDLLWQFSIAERPAQSAASAPTPIFVDTRTPFLLGNWAALAANALVAVQLGVFQQSIEWVGALLAAVALAQVVASALLRARPLAVGAPVAAGLGFGTWLLAMLSQPTAGHVPASEWTWLCTGALSLCLFAMGELYRVLPRGLAGESDGRGRGVFAHGWEVLAAVTLSVGICTDVEPANRAVLFMLLAAGLSTYALVARSAPAGLASFVGFVPGVLLGMSVVGYMTNAAWMPVVLGLAIYCALLSESRWWGARPGLRYHQWEERGPHLLYLGVALIAGGWMIDAWQGLPEVAGLAALGVVAAGLAFVLQGRALTFVSTAVLLCVGWHWYLLDGLVSLAREQGCWVVVIAALGAGRILSARAAYPKRVAENLLVVLAWVLLGGFYLEGNGFLVREQRIAIAFLVHAVLTRAPASMVVSMVTALWCVGIGVSSAYDGSAPRENQVLMLGLAVGYWFAMERIFAIALRRKLLDHVENIGLLHPLFIAVPPALLVVMLERVPVLADFYLTIAWTAAAAGVMVVALLTREKFYRYAALSIFALALGRVALVDTRELEGLYRVGAVMFLGVVLLAVGYGYIKARERGANRD